MTILKEVNMKDEAFATAGIGHNKEVWFRKD